ncbi:hypothetical protein oki169_24870 [Helicobacter pylori]|uniref:Zn-dependent hydrolase n=1 Tax=Campylobacter jejuni subsp. doylei TaxID=32021 RepID=A0A3S4W2Z2_CAMJU|nr:hypothetical protein B11447_08520 [Campylobacter jejuni]SQE24179.1 zn-dependent hydrolase [Campylobacter jejuni subsp. doylei]VEG61462.1 zn-dependent hydrolase [Campylobacter jejuni subsp. doylei]VTX57788.1 Uncharacterised protein [Campylobacter jejuni]
MPIHWGRFLAGTHAWNEVVKFLYENLDLLLITPKMGEAYGIGLNLNRIFGGKKDKLTQVYDLYFDFCYSFIKLKKEIL